MPLLITAGLAMLLNLSFSWPGIMTWDSNNQYMQAVSGQYDDWFPPIMAVVWRWLLVVAPWGTGLLTLHLALWWAGLTLLAVALFHSDYKRGAWFALAVGATPVLVLLNSFILKDVGLDAAIIFAFGIIVLHRILGKRISIFAWVVIIVLFGYACLVRQNGVFAVAPLICYAVNPRLSRIVVMLLANCFLVTLVVIGISGPINRHLINAKDGNAKRSLVLFDTTGIAYWSRDNSVFRRPVNPPLEIIDACYDPALWDQLAQIPCKPIIEQDYVTATTMVYAVLKHPLSYVKHRLVHFNRELFLWAPNDSWQFGDQNRLAGQPVGTYDMTQRDALRILDSLPFFSPAFALAIISVIFIMMLIYRQFEIDKLHEAVFFLSLSAILYTLGFAVIGVANMYRYYEYPVVACALSLVMYVSSIRSRKDQENRVVFWTIGMCGLAVLTITSIARCYL